MSRVRNADEFLVRLRGIRRAYEDRFAPLIKRVRATYTGRIEESAVDQSLEAHVRAYVINALLAALNWRLDVAPEHGLPNLVPEAPVTSEARKTTRFLDYFGLERDTVNPLLIIETKRASAELPRGFEPSTRYSEIVSRALAGEALSGEWNTWVEDIRDYVRSVYTRTQKVPKRVVVTNGNWLIVFMNPTDAFLENGTRDPNLIIVFRDEADVEKRFREFFLCLEYRQVGGEAPILDLGQLNFYLSAETVDRAMHGLRVRYIAPWGIYHYSPVIRVAPVVFLHSRYGDWLSVEKPPQEYELPHKSDYFQPHLDEVQKAAKNLLAEINGQLCTSLDPFPLSRHYEGTEFDALRGVVESSEDDYIVVTGEATHYLLLQPTVASCPYHDWAYCNHASVASNPGPIMERSTEPRSFFMSAELHHCAHRNVDSAKAMALTGTNLSRCGPRSGQEGQAFCEIWRFEQHLCCRTCVFEEVCTKTGVFQLPCRRI